MWPLPVLLVFVFVIAFIVSKYVLKPANFPPGPPRIPLLGSVPFLPQGLGRMFYFKMTEKFGPIFSFYLGPQPFVVLSNAKQIREVFKMQEVSARAPNRPFDDIRSTEVGGIVTGLIVSNGDTWTEQRRFALRSLRNMGLGKARMDDIMRDEMIRLCDRFAKNVGEPIILNNKMNLSIVSALWTIITSETMDLEDPQSQRSIENINRFSREGADAPNLFSMLIPDVYRHFSSNLRYFSEGYNSALDIFKPHIEEHLRSLDPESPRDFLDLYLMEMATSKPGSSFHGSAGQKSLEVSLVDLFVGGSETTTTSLLWLFLYLLHHPKVQEKVHEEIDFVIGQTSVKQEDKDRLPYTQAVILESMRFSSLLPFGIPHQTASKVEVGGFTIPKNCNVIANAGYAHYDPSYWTEPSKFNPERFLKRDPDSEVKVILNHSHFMPFSVGKRSCLGQTLAEKGLFLFFSGIMQRFKLGNPEGYPLPDISIENDKGEGIIRTPPIYYLQLTERNIGHL